MLNLLPIDIITKWLRKNQLIFILISVAAFLLSIEVLSHLVNSMSCANQQNIVPINSWRVKNTTPPVTIGWQRELTHDDSLISATNNSLVFFRGATNSPCVEGNKLMALKPTTGDQYWDTEVELVRGIFQNDDSYILISCCTSIIRIDNTGRKDWESQDFPTKIYYPRVFIDQGEVYFPSDIGMFILSLQDGTLEKTISTPNIIGVFNGFLVKDSGDQLQIVSEATNKISWELPVDQPLGVSSNYLLSSGGLLVIVNNYEQISVYDLNSGQKRWQVSEPLLAYPVIHGSKLITYGRGNEVSVYDLDSGDLTNRIMLERIANQQVTSSAPLNGVQLAANDNGIFIFFNNTSELLNLVYKSS